MALRLDASEFTTAGVISSWSDISGNGHDTTTVYSDPTVELGVQNGLAVVSLDGNDSFRVGHTYTTGSAFIVAKYDNTNWDFYDGLYGASTGNGAAEQYFTGNGSNSGTGWSNEAGSGFQNSKWLNGDKTIIALTNPSAFNLYSGTDTTSPASFASWSIGADRGNPARAWEGDIAEVIVYEEALSDFDRMGVEVYLDEKWGLGQNLSTDISYVGNYNTDLVALGVVAVPEPSSAALLGLGGLALILRRRK